MDEKYIVLDFNPNYAVSDQGNVMHVKKGNILVPRINKSGYYYVQLSFGSRDKRRNYRIHRLVAMCFLENSDNKPYVNHIDGDKKNNRVSNLEWVTAKENDTHARRKGLKGGNKPIKSTNIATGEEMEFYSLGECARYFDCNKAYIHRALNGSYGMTQYKGYKLEYIRI